MYKINNGPKLVVVKESVDPFEFRCNPVPALGINQMECIQFEHSHYFKMKEEVQHG